MKHLLTVILLTFLVPIFAQNIACLEELKVNITPEKNITLSGQSFNKLERSQGDVNRWKTIYSGTSVSTYTDESAISGEMYMYRVSRNSVPQAFASAGIEVSPVHYRGRLLLLIDETFKSSLANKIQRWIDDAEGDGWTVITKTIQRGFPITMVKNIIREEYNSEAGLQSLFLFGHIPVPYSGEQALDGHSNHLGAWPADIYYAEMNEQWTDITVNRTGVPGRTQNIPNDGKFDQSIVRDLELQIGRVDFFDMPSVPLSEEQLLEKYLDKNHSFRTKEFTPGLQAFSQNNILNGGSPCKYKLMYPALVGSENVYTGTYRNALRADSYLFAHGAGFGSFTTCAGISTTTSMGTDSLQAVFTSSFGSYFGDWDTTDNFLRSHLASGTILTTHYTSTFKYYRMGLGSTIGLETKLSAQGHNLTDDERSSNSVALNLLGDPTLRMLMVYPVSNEEVSFSENEVTISWDYTESKDDVSGFNIYRKSPSDQHYIFLKTVPNNQLNYIDDAITESGETRYMIRTQKLENVLAGSYHNQSTGRPITIDIPFVDLDGDGFDSFEDCDDDNANVYPGQNEIQINVDDNCNGIVDEVDADNDGFFDFEDCDDSNPAINPLANEIINNGIDENCDGLDDLNANCYQSNEIPSEILLDIELCDDLPKLYENASILHNSAFVFKGQVGRTYSFDYCENYDEQIWKSFNYVAEYNKTTREIGAVLYTNVGCQIEFKFSENLAFPDFLIVVKNIEECSSSEFTSTTPNGRLTMECVYIDQDNDGFFDYEDCDDTNPQVNSDQIEIPFNGIDDDCNENTIDNDGDQDGSPIDEDCDDNNPMISPLQVEIPNNGIDEDCDGIIDEIDMDGDGFDNFEDCDDTNPAIFPGAYDFVNNGIDEDCDGMDNTADTCTYYWSGPHDDFEGKGDYCLDGPFTSSFSVQAFNSYALFNLTPNTNYFYGFCDTGNTITWIPIITVVQYDQASEKEGQIIAAASTCEIYFNFPYDSEYPDVLIIVTDGSQDCKQPTTLPNYINATFGCIDVDSDNDGYVLGEDCDDEDPNVNPGVAEIPYNGIDDDCNGQTLDDDIDRDGYFLADDCDDNNADINPDQVEITYNGFDDDCNPETQDDDLDQDGFDLVDDCDDTNPDINPDAVEIPDNDIDEDCDGMDLLTSTYELSNTIVNIYPNPFIETINIDVTGDLNYTISLLDINGQLIMTENNSSILSTRNIPQGSYLLEIRDLDTGSRIVELLIKSK